MKKSINETPISEYINTALEKRGMTQAELATKSRISTPVINDIIKGRRGVSPRQIVKFSIILGLDAIELGRMQSDFEIMQIIAPMIDKED